ncbi:hypothetical protein Ndes2526B_g04370 [Nannochloris sp. 'desiccata']
MSDAPDQPPAKLPRPHRCNDRVEDLLQALFTLDFSEKIRPAWRNFRKCMKSEPGSEPTDPYLIITDPQRYLDPLKMSRKKNPETFQK